ncbi:hypothetical protein LEP1GSC150_4948 [Leptospira interrogans serovar Copenhageni str. LT2050]|uniref:Uncharacterized protein n=1 Tax=Leptospira interrogans serovar Copenhageni str. LT2050 TaxID=1001598 RepID=M3IFM4_LEPIT|nr:hypothetical protein LEP1GSC150_4948 [Leptospira interrogans serovar Copenhageni str. LT2050]
MKFKKEYIFIIFILAVFLILFLVFWPENSKKRVVSIAEENKVVLKTNIILKWILTIRMLLILLMKIQIWKFRRKNFGRKHSVLKKLPKKKNRFAKNGRTL